MCWERRTVGAKTERLPQIHEDPRDENGIHASQELLLNGADSQGPAKEGYPDGILSLEYVSHQLCCGSNCPQSLAKGCNNLAAGLQTMESQTRSSRERRVSVSIRHLTPSQPTLHVCCHVHLQNVCNKMGNVSDRFEQSKDERTTKRKLRVHSNHCRRGAHL